MTDRYLNTRLLPVEEWHKLPVMDTRICDINHTNIMVVERAGEIVANWSLMPIYHAEGLWVREDYRKNPAVARRLIKGMKTMVKTMEVPYIVTMSQSEEVTKLLGHLKSEKLNGDFYLIVFED